MHPGKHLPARRRESRAGTRRGGRTLAAGERDAGPFAEKPLHGGGQGAAHLPDTGMACVFVELGRDARIDGDLQAAIDEGVRRGYEKGYLRKSITADPLKRVNTGDNTPPL